MNGQTDRPPQTTRPTTESDEHEREVVVRLLQYEESALVVVIYSLVSLVAIVGNCSIVYIILRMPRLRTPTNYLLLNLAIADLLMAALCIPFSYWPVLILQRWPFGWMLCKGIHFSQAAVIMSSAYTLMAISCDRFLAIMWPLKTAFKLSTRRALATIAVVWLVAVVIASPLLLVMDLQQGNNSELHCVEIWASGVVSLNATASSSAAAYSVAAMFLQYFLPLVVLIVTYSGIGLRLWRSKIPGEAAQDALKGRQDSVKKMISTMFIVTSVYAICWLPLNVFNILLGIYNEIADYEYVLYVWGACHFLAMCNTMANPLIYGFRFRRFRQGFAFLFRWLPGVSYSSAGGGYSTATNEVSKSPNTACLLRPSIIKRQKDDHPRVRMVMTDSGSCNQLLAPTSSEMRRSRSICAAGRRS